MVHDLRTFGGAASKSLYRCFLGNGIILGAGMHGMFALGGPYYWKLVAEW